jgi:hypothetical protein
MSVRVFVREDEVCGLFGQFVSVRRISHASTYGEPIAVGILVVLKETPRAFVRPSGRLILISVRQNIFHFY